MCEVLNAIVHRSFARVDLVSDVADLEDIPVGRTIDGLQVEARVGAGDHRGAGVLVVLEGLEIARRVGLHEGAVVTEDHPEQRRRGLLRVAVARQGRGCGGRRRGGWSAAAGG